VRLSEASTPVLVGLVALGDGVVAALATNTLERIGRPAVQPVARLLLAAPAPTRRRAAEALARLPHAGSDEDQVRAGLELLLRKDPDWVVRAQVALAMGMRGARDRTTEPVVIEAAAEGLTRLGDPLAVPALIQSLSAAADRGDLPSVQALQKTLRALTGEQGEGGLEGWRRWWFEHRDELQRAAASR
jgi:HEAT repeat protein